MMNRLERVDFPQYACLMAMTATIARSEDPDTQVGACILDEEGRMISTGYNGFKSKCNVEYATREDKLLYMIHAEQNAILLIGNRKPYLIGLTHSPCRGCALGIASAGIKEVYYYTEYHRETDFKKVFDAYNIKYSQINPKYKLVPA